ncbi:MAG: phytanoyl-CoA dioxygenase family protein, partial [Pseudomonadota bacterium]
EHFFEHGYVILPEWLDASEVNVLSEVCDALLAEPPDDDQGGKSHDIGRGEDRRFLRHRHRDYPKLSNFVLGQQMKDLASAFVGGSPHLFNEQFVVKGAKTGSAFGWHQDGGYVGFDHKPYLSVWISIDETTADNGPVFVLPRNLKQDIGLVPHHWDEDAKEMVCYDGPDPGIAAIVPAGSVVLFSSVTLHRSSRNTTDNARRAYLAQFSGEPLLRPDTGKPKVFATAL